MEFLTFTSPSLYEPAKAFRSDSFQDIYTHTAVIGSGGYGQVYSSTHNVNKTTHATKVIPNHNCRHKTFCPKRDTKVPDEVALWEPLDHPGIVKLQDVFFDSSDFTWILVMEYDPEFVDMFYFIDHHGVMSSSDAANVIKQLLDICFYLALQGVDHKDIKDENILYNPRTKQIKLIDFGSAMPLTTDEYTIFKGTDVYVPPEYWNNHSYYPFPATVFAIGCLSFILLNGDSPFNQKKDVKEFDGDIEKLPTFTGNSLGEMEKDFLTGCLRPCPHKRPNMPELLQHPFLQ